METGRIFLRWLVALALFGQNVHQHRVIQLFRLPKHLAELGNVVPVHRPQIGDAHILKEHPRDKQLLDAVLGALDLVDHGRAHHGNPVQGVGHVFLQVVIAAACSQAVQIARHSAHVLGNGHFIVVEHDDEILLHARRVVQCLVGHSAG